MNPAQRDAPPNFPVPIEITRLLEVLKDASRDEVTQLVQAIADTNWLFGNNFPSLSEKPPTFAEGDLVTALDGGPRARVVAVNKATSEIELEYTVAYTKSPKISVAPGNREKMTLRDAQQLGVSFLQ